MRQVADILRKYWKIILAKALATVIPGIGSEVDSRSQFLPQSCLKAAGILGILDGIWKISGIKTQIHEIVSGERAGLSEQGEHLRSALRSQGAGERK